MHANLRVAFSEMPATVEANLRLRNRHTTARRFIRQEAAAAGAALAPLAPALAHALRQYTSASGGGGLAQLRSKAPSLRRFGRAVAFALPAPARAAVEAVLLRAREGLAGAGAGAGAAASGSGGGDGGAGPASAAVPVPVAVAEGAAGGAGVTATGTGSVSEAAAAVLGQRLFENEALGTVVASALEQAGLLRTDAAGWLCLAPAASVPR